MGTPRRHSPGRGAHHRGAHPDSRVRSRAATARPNGYDPSKSYRFIVVCVILISFVIAMRLIWVQGVNSHSLAEQARAARTHERVITALRGDILDRNGEVLATSVERYDIWVNQRQVAEYRPSAEQGAAQGPGAAAAQLAPVLGMSVEDLEEVLTGESGFRYVAKTVDPQVNDAVLGMRIPGIGSDRVQQRLYPSGEVGANVIGFTGADGTALAGAELTFDEQLRGTDGKVVFERGAGGQAIPTAQRSETPAVDGYDVQLTIDRDIQYKSQEVIARTVQEWGAAGGSIVAIDIATGEILALADYPTYDPNNPGATDAQYRGNQSISNVFEPGSTGKLFTLAGLINEGDASLEDRLVVPHTKSFGGESIKDALPHPDKNYTLAGILKNSSNVGTVELANRQDLETRYEYLRAFGLGEATGVELPGESAGIVHPPGDWQGRTAYTVAFGQGYAVNALQMTSAVGTFGHDGVRVQPRIVRASGVDAQTLRAEQPPASTRVVSSETATTMLQLMDNNVADDGSQNGWIPHYAVGGKSGTAQVPDGSYTSSFIGMAPIDDPQIVLGVFVYGIQGFQSGSQVAAPAFSEIMGYTLQSRSIAPTGVPGLELENEW